MQVGSTTGAAETITLLQGSSANASEQANRQIQQQLETTQHETAQ